jgi:HD-GYP domain-containing protein (c-di-GMP phosphodiesterase class II)
MLNLRLSHPIYTLDNQLLMPENTQISQKTLDTLISSNKNKSSKTYPLFKYGSVKDDFLAFLLESNYRIIFAEQKKTLPILRVLEKVCLTLPVLQSLDYFKEHDVYTYRHILTVFALSNLLAMNLLDKRKDLIKEYLAGPTHDFGKICVTLDVLQKTDPLTKRENSMLKHHAVAGYVLLSYYYRDKHNFYAKVARDHHERRDESGYPRGITLRDQLIEIVAVSDIYDALISHRPYRTIPYDNRSALEEITTMAEIKRFSWKVVRALIALTRKSKPHYSTCKVSSQKRGSPPLENKYGHIISIKDYHISEDIKRRTIQCSQNFQCLIDDYWEMCTIERAATKDGLVIKKRKHENDCRYLLLFGNSYICHCPTRYELYNEYHV